MTLRSISVREGTAVISLKRGIQCSTGECNKCHTGKGSKYCTRMCSKCARGKCNKCPIGKGSESLVWESFIQSKLMHFFYVNFLKYKTFSISEYKLVAFISHMGTSTMVGHYVCHIKKEGRWVIYNDEKVALSENPPRDLAYLYLYQRQ